MRNTHIR